MRYILRGLCFWRSSKVFIQIGLFTILQISNPGISWAVSRYWVATANASWHNPSNWSNFSGGPGGYSVPGSGDQAIFDGGGPGSCSISNTVAVGSLLITVQYSGVIQLSNGISLFIQSTGLTQTGGTFQGNLSHLKVNGGLTLTGGLFTTMGTMDANLGPVPDVIMDFEGSQEPVDPGPSRTPDPNGVGNGCLDPSTWNSFYVRDVCVAPTCPVTHYAMERSSQHSRSGNYSLRCFMQPTPLNLWPQNGEATHRAELAPKYDSPFNHYPTEGQEVWYGISYYFPSDFVFAPENIEHDIRFIISQWQHGTGGPGIIAFEVIGDEIMLQRQSGTSTNPVWITPIPLITIQRGQWMDFVVRVKWSKTAGLVQIWCNNNQVLNLNSIPTIYGNLSVGGGLKPGIYYWRWKDQQSVINTLNAGISDREIFIDDIRIYRGLNAFEYVKPGQ